MSNANYGNRDPNTLLMGAMVESVVDGIIVIDESGAVEMMNSAAERLFGYQANELIGRNVNSLMPDPYRSEHDNYIDNYLKTGVRRMIGIGREVIGQRKDGSTFPMYLSVGEVSLGGHKRFTGIVHDLTERKQADEKIFRHQHHQRLILNAVGDGIIGLDMEKRINFANPAAGAMLGCNEDHLIGSKLEKVWLHHHNDNCPVYRVLQEGIVRRGEDALFLHRYGNPFPVEYSVTPVSEAGKLVGAVICFRDITERKRSAREVQRMRYYLKNILDSMPSILIGVDTEGRITELNQGAERASGVAQAEAQGHSFVEIFPYLESQRDRVRAAIRNRIPLRNERIVFEKEGWSHYADVMVYPLMTDGIMGAVVRVDDVTQRVRIEEMMVQTEKMMSIGGLAAGMAHEINNPLSAILQSCQNILRRVSADLPANIALAEQLDLDLAKVHLYLTKRGILRFLEGIHDAGKRASRIVADMLAFSRRSDAEFAPTRVDEILDTVIRLAASDYDLKKKYDFRQVKIIKDYDPNLVEISCDRTEIEQVMLNLVKNAAQAMNEAGTPQPRRIILRTRRKGNDAFLQVEDNGPGMDEDIRHRVFEPFYTTKRGGKGTGLGLSVSYFIITEQHGGEISVSSTLGQGSCFTIRLPVNGKRQALQSS